MEQISHVTSVCSLIVWIRKMFMFLFSFIPLYDKMTLKMLIPLFRFGQCSFRLSSTQLTYIWLIHQKPVKIKITISIVNYLYYSISFHSVNAVVPKRKLIKRCQQQEARNRAVFVKFKLHYCFLPPTDFVPHLAPLGPRGGQDEVLRHHDRARLHQTVCT